MRVGISLNFGVKPARTTLSEAAMHSIASGDLFSTVAENVVLICRVFFLFQVALMIIRSTHHQKDTRECHLHAETLLLPDPI